MTTIDPSGYSEAGAHLFTWLADKVLGGAKKALGWGWTQVEWARAQDRYDERIIKDYGQIRIFGQTTPKSLKDIFTDVYVLDTPTAYRRFDPAALAEHLWNEDRGLSFRHVERRPGEQLLTEGSKFYILGKPGAGKTTFLKHLAVREAQRGRWGACLGKIPIFVSLKQFGETSQSLFDFIVDEFAVCGFPDGASFVETLLKSGGALVLFDGLDEVSKTEERDRRGEVTQMLAQFARQYGECHIVVTCRIAAVDYTFEPAFIYLEMADFAPDQVEAFVRAWFWDESDQDNGVALAEGMLAALELPEHKGIRDLNRNPLLLTLLCLYYAEALSFPTRRVEIYEEALDALLKTWDKTRHVERGGDLYKKLSLEHKQQMLTCIAFDAMARGQVIFSQAELERRLVDYLANIPELPGSIDIDGDAVLKEIVAQHGIFVEQSRRMFSFAHLTLQEYYTARWIAMDGDSEALGVLFGHISDHDWREIFLLVTAMMRDTSPFFARYEAALRDLLTRSPRVVTLLRWLDEQASRSQAGFLRNATRVYYADDIFRCLYAQTYVESEVIKHSSPVVGRSIAHTRLLKRMQSSQALSFPTTQHFGNISDARPLRMDDINLDRDLHKTRKMILDPQLDSARTSQEGAGFQQLVTETRTLAEKASEAWQLQPDDFALIVAYSHGTVLFYDCLQLSNNPTRRTFEDRIFLPPP